MKYRRFVQGTSRVSYRLRMKPWRTSANAAGTPTFGEWPTPWKKMQEPALHGQGKEVSEYRGNSDGGVLVPTNYQYGHA